MFKEGIQVDLTGVTRELPFRDYYRGRNGLVAQKIAAFLDLPYMGEAREGGAPAENVYYVPPTTQLRDRFNSEADFYGLSVSDINHVHKAILHRTVSVSVPGFYSPFFAESVRDLVLPGTVAFSKDDIRLAYRQTRRSGNFNVRVKIPDQSDGHGQFVITHESDLAGLANSVNGAVPQRGLVFEADLENTRTISVGFANLLGSTFSFIALQKNDIAPEDGRNRYMGASVRVVRGGIGNLTMVAENDQELTAVEKSAGFFEAYSYFDPAASRLSFDNLIGEDLGGQELSGITDITGRLGGTCPALAMSVLAFKENREAVVVKSEVSLNYNPSQETESEHGAERFIDLPSLRLSARVNEVI